MDTEEELTAKAIARADAEARKRAFIRFALEAEVLRFGQFTLKSGRQSPYFFDSGRFRDGRSLGLLGSFYAATWMATGIPCDVVFGPAYKGIPLAVTTASALAREHGRNHGVTFNRKEAKDHGEGGWLVGAELTGRVLLVDDVITSGAAIREVLPLIETAGASLVGIVTALDRQERGRDSRSAVQELEDELAVPVFSIISLGDLESWLDSAADGTWLDAVRIYRERYGCEPRVMSS
ncbi:MAG: orotate phosphoribosyltransferase [Gammaproteobacteria bacterium]|nr:orotate phosphoribosyltransferase [Gammaproteobacteria bacterium]